MPGEAKRGSMAELRRSDRRDSSLGAGNAGPSEKSRLLAPGVIEVQDAGEAKRINGRIAQIRSS
jgi:hypothetical protein